MPLTKENSFKFSYDKPPCWQKIVDFFPDDAERIWKEGMAITYGDTVYSKYKLRPDVAVHEMVHIEQQKGIDKDEFVDRYLSDPVFRIHVEEPAYKAQAEYIKDCVSDRNLRFRLIHQLALALSGPMYGKMMSYSDALKLLN